MFCRRVPVPRRPGPQKHDPCPGDVYVPLSPLPAPQDLHWKGRGRGPRPTFPVCWITVRMWGEEARRSWTEETTEFAGGAGVAGRVLFRVSAVRTILPFKGGCN